MGIRVARADELFLLQVPCTFVIRPGPNPVTRRHISCSCKIAHEPHSWQKPTDVRSARKCRLNLDDTTREAEFIPTLYHPALEMLCTLPPLVGFVVDAWEFCVGCRCCDI